VRLQGGQSAVKAAGKVAPVANSWMSAAYTKTPPLAKNVEYIISLDAKLTQPPQERLPDVFEVRELCYRVRGVAFASHSHLDGAQGVTGLECVRCVQALRRLQRKESRRVDDLFRECDKDRDGRLSAAELAALLRKGTPALSQRQLRHAMLMMKTDASSTVTYKELITTLKESERLDLWRGQGDSSDGHSIGMYEVLLRLSAMLRRERCTFERGFARYDRDADGCLNPAELAVLARGLFPPLTDPEVAHAVHSMLQQVQHSLADLITLEELRKTMLQISFQRAAAVDPFSQ
jgi:Ca2+-binding EF-hand superfamily protein